MHTEFQDILQAAIDAGVAFDAILTDDERQLVAAYRDHQELPVVPQIALTAEDRRQAEEEFATLAAAEALMALARKIESVLSRRREELYVRCLEAFYVAEEYHQGYAASHPNQPYIAAVAMPKVQKLRTYFPGRLKGSVPAR